MGIASADRVQAPFGSRSVAVRAAERHGAYTVLRCADPGGPRPQAGQFYMLRAAERWGGGVDERPFLPRAFSVLRAGGVGAAGRGRLHGDELQFLIEDVGPGTRRLCELTAGDELMLVGPLGNGFAAPGDGRRPLLVGGGVGIAPLAILQDQLAQDSGPPSGGRQSWSLGPTLATTFAEGRPAVAVLLGFRDADHAPGADLLTDARIATDDGSVGHHGFVTELLAAELDRPEAHLEVYACGPPPMLEAVRRLCVEAGTPAQLALESGMACGFGACFGCVVPTHAGYIRLCVDGPVIRAADLPSALTPGAGH